MLILKNARVLPELTPGLNGEEADIIVNDGKIAEINEAGKAHANTSAQVIDVGGATVLPGFIDAHVHLDLCGKNIYEENTEPDAYRVLRSLRMAKDSLRNGFTTLRDMGDRHNTIICLAKAIRNGWFVGPDILASGMILTPTEIGNSFYEGLYLEADDPGEYTKAVRRQRQLGADWIKLMGTGAIFNPGGSPGAAIISEEELAALTRAAEMAGLPVACHAHGAEGIKMAIRAGIRTIEHSSIMDDECYEMYKKSGRSFMIPTVSPKTHIIEHPEQHPPHAVEKSRIYHQIMCEVYSKAYKQGLKMGFGTDAGVYEGGHGNGIYEMRARVKYIGMTSRDVIIQATKDTAEILQIDDKVGTLAVGKNADLVMLTGKPDEDIEAAAAVRMVIKDGEIVNV